MPPLRRGILALALALALCATPARAQDHPVLAELEAMVKEAVRKVAPSVVQIITQGGSDIVVTGSKGQTFRKALGPTTGVIVGSDGYIVSSTFNFINNPTSIFVNVPGRDEPLVARKIATDKTRRLTLLKVDATGLPVPTAVPKKEIHEGQWAIALGRTLEAKRGGPPSVSLGVISAKGRIWGKALQTDAKTSPVNYGGALVDVLGRVQGVIVPVSPHSEEETAGYEWYDSGIGFAIPLEDVFAALPRLKEGKDLTKAVLGVRMKSQDIYGVPPEVADVVKDSAAARAGIKPGDVLTAVDGVPVSRMAQVLHVLGTKYEGDKISLKFKRGKEELAAADVVLSGNPFTVAHPFLGILPLRDDPKLGVEVRHVFEKSPAAKAGLQPGDRAVKFGGDKGPLQPFTGQKPGRDQLLDWLHTQQPGGGVKLEVRRKDGKTETLALTLDALPGSTPNEVGTVPDKLPEPASKKQALAPREGARPAKAAEKKNDAKPETGLLKRTSNDGERNYWVYVPENYDPNIAHAVLVWLHPPGKNKDEEVDTFIELWRDFAEEKHLILVGPLSSNEAGWLPSDAEYVAEAVRDVLGKYTVDRQRIVAHGMGVGGQMAAYVGFHHRDLFRGVAPVGATVQPVKDNVPNQRLSFYVAAGSVDPITPQIAESKNKLVEKRYPVVYREIANRGREYLEETQLRELVRWIDSLDRL